MSKLPDIYGFNKTSEAGVNVFAPSIFLKGCNLRCPYCINARLVRDKVESVDINKIKQYVAEEKCEWVMISGGEPTMTPINALIALINECKSWGCKVGLSTNGSNPDVLQRLLPLLDYVALDMKCYRVKDYVSLSPEHKKESYLINLFRSWSKIVENKLSRSNFEYEVRTTLFPPFIDKKAIRELGSALRFDTNWILQQFRHSENMLNKEAYDIEPYTEDEIKKLLEIAKRYCKNARLRYV